MCSYSQDWSKDNSKDSFQSLMVTGCLDLLKPQATLVHTRHIQWESCIHSFLFNPLFTQSNMSTIGNQYFNPEMPYFPRRQDALSELTFTLIYAKFLVEIVFPRFTLWLSLFISLSYFWDQLNRSTGQPKEWYSHSMTYKLHNHVIKTIIVAIPFANHHPQYLIIGHWLLETDFISFTTLFLSNFVYIYIYITQQ